MYCCSKLNFMTLKKYQSPFLFYMFLFYMVLLFIGKWIAPGSLSVCVVTSVRDAVPQSSSLYSANS